MGCDIHSFAEVRNKETGKWEKVGYVFPESDNKMTDEPFSVRSYSVFGFIANVKNLSESPFLQEYRGLPDDSEYLNAVEEVEYFHHIEKETKKSQIEERGYFGYGYLILKEITDFDYDQSFEDRRYASWPDGKHIKGTGSERCEPGQGEMVKYKDFLPSQFFEDVEILKTLGDPEDVRIVFWFDN